MKQKPVVYFSRSITPEKVLELYRLCGKELTGHVAVKVHSGEKGNQNFLRPDFWKPMIDWMPKDRMMCWTFPMAGSSSGTLSERI